LIKRR